MTAIKDKIKLQLLNRTKYNDKILHTHIRTRTHNFRYKGVSD